MLASFITKRALNIMAQGRRRKLDPSERPYVEFSTIVNPGVRADKLTKDGKRTVAKAEHRANKKLYLTDPSGSLNSFARAEKIRNYENKDGWEIVAYGNFDYVKARNTDPDRLPAFLELENHVSRVVGKNTAIAEKDSRIAELERQLDELSGVEAQKKIAASKKAKVEKIQERTSEN